MAERPGRNESVAAGGLTRDNTGFLLAKASQHWNELLRDRFTAAGYADVRPAYGALLVPLYEQDGLRQGELARRARLSKQTMTTMARALEQAGLVERRADPSDARATRLYLTARAQELRPVAERVLAELDHLVAAAIPIELADLRAGLHHLIRVEAGGGGRRR